MFQGCTIHKMSMSAAAALWLFRFFEIKCIPVMTHSLRQVTVARWDNGITVFPECWGGVGGCGDVIATEPSYIIFSQLH